MKGVTKQPLQTWWFFLKKRENVHCLIKETVLLDTWSRAFSPTFSWAKKFARPKVTACSSVPPLWCCGLYMTFMHTHLGWISVKWGEFGSFHFYPFFPFFLFLSFFLYQKGYAQIRNFWIGYPFLSFFLVLFFFMSYLPFVNVTVFGFCLIKKIKGGIFRELVPYSYRVKHTHYHLVSRYHLSGRNVLSLIWSNGWYKLKWRNE